MSQSTGYCIVVLYTLQVVPVDEEWTGLGGSLGFLWCHGTPCSAIEGGFYVG